MVVHISIKNKKKISIPKFKTKYKRLNYYAQRYSKLLLQNCLFPEHVSVQMYYLRMATVRASGEVAHGQITSGFRP